MKIHGPDRHPFFLWSSSSQSVLVEYSSTQEVSWDKKSCLGLSNFIGHILLYVFVDNFETVVVVKGKAEENWIQRGRK